MKKRKSVWQRFFASGLSVKCVVLIIFCSILVSGCALRSTKSDGRVEYPGNGPYYLSKYYPYSLSDMVATEDTLNIDFVTDSTEIKITNCGVTNISVCLIDKDNPTDNCIAELELLPNDENHFTMLSGSITYQIKIGPSGTNYAITVTD